jgi:acylphosphatase
MIRHVIVRGRVQGVGYRAFVEEAALKLGLEGWVRNRRDATVEAVFSGSDDVVARMIEACHRGPSLSRVEAVDAQDAADDVLAPRRSGERFSVLATA